MKTILRSSSLHLDNDHHLYLHQHKSWRRWWGWIWDSSLFCVSDYCHHNMSQSTFILHECHHIQVKRLPTLLHSKIFCRHRTSSLVAFSCILALSTVGNLAFAYVIISSKSSSGLDYHHHYHCSGDIQWFWLDNIFLSNFLSKAPHDSDDVFGFIGKYKSCLIFNVFALIDFLHRWVGIIFFLSKASFLDWLSWIQWSTVHEVFCLFWLHALHRLIGQSL